uniref:Uncharacterized protein n=1 Tax=Strombidium rassoulzadegani TaxID=1082188 RepID=A0A7S3FWB0_9SPIT|mmetsp:Transcript_13909/g.23675  ORF Transcript_13909/g.23675 Transcript_13909/m.23675 type:complete len:109 (+) Transcript_13909:301-627(+)
MLLVVFILSNLGKKGDMGFQRPKNDQLTNMRMVQLMQTQTVTQIEESLWFIEDFLYWRSPERTLFLLTVLLCASLALSLAVFLRELVPLRYYVVIAIWAAPLHKVINQ